MYLSEEVILHELAYMSSSIPDAIDFLEEANQYLYDIGITESEEKYNKITEHLRLEILDVDKFIKINECKPISNPRAFDRDNIPSPDGILSNTIFGITNDERTGIYGYIDLHCTFIDPSCYKAWVRIDKNIKSIVHGTDTFKVDDRGHIVQDPNGETGLKFLKKNINKIKFISTESVKRDIKVRYLEKNRDKMFITKYLVIPPYYRDKNTSGSSRVVGLSGINKLYTDLIVAANALTATQDFMFDASYAMEGRTQEIILSIYDWFCGNTNAAIGDKDKGTGLSGKFGILRRAAMSKTANYASRLVITAPELKVETPEDMKVDFDYTAIPLVSAITEFKDFVMFHTKRFFENEFVGTETYPVITKDGKLKYMTPKDPAIMFSDERIKLEMDRYTHGYNNRFVPIEIEMEEQTKEKVYMQFRGRRSQEIGKVDPESIYSRRLTWCDVFFIAAHEAIKGKHVLITRFPIFRKKTSKLF